MTQHIESPLPKSAPPKATRFDDALAEAKRHLDRIPRHNRLALGIQKGIIQYWERLVAAERGEEWLQ